MAELMKQAFRICLIGSIAATHVVAVRAQQPKLPTPAVDGARLTDASEFESWVDSFLTEQTINSPMPSLALVVVKNGEVFFQKGYGQTQAGNIVVRPEETLFRAASVSKLVTATAVMQLVERGKLSLDTDINTYLTRFQLENSYPSPTTARHLLTHTSGIEDRLFGNSLPSADRLVSLGDYFAAHIPRRFVRPGSRSLTRIPEWLWQGIWWKRFPVSPLKNMLSGTSLCRWG